MISVRARVRARVRNGRLVVDEPTELPEGTEIDLVAERPMTPEEFKAWLATVPPAPEKDRLTPDDVERLRAAANGPAISHEELKRRLAARKT